MATEDANLVAPTCVACGRAEPPALVEERLDGRRGWMLKRRVGEDGLRFDAFCPECRPSWRDLSSSAIRVRAALFRAAR